ncbi:hypothetical protein Tco_0374665 [Tanacetum coccineum]
MGCYCNGDPKRRAAPTSENIAPPAPKMPKLVLKRKSERVGYVDCQSKEFHLMTGKKLGFTENMGMFLLIKSKMSATTLTENGHFAKRSRSGRNQGERSYGGQWLSLVALDLGSTSNSRKLEATVISKGLTSRRNKEAAARRHSLVKSGFGLLLILEDHICYKPKCNAPNEYILSLSILINELVFINAAKYIHLLSDTASEQSSIKVILLYGFQGRLYAASLSMLDDNSLDLRQNVF